MKNPRAEKSLLTVHGLSKYFVKKNRLIDYLRAKKPSVLRAVEDVSFSIQPGETLGLVGESGCGKSTLGRCLLRLHEPTSGEIYFQGENILGYPPAKQQQLYSKIQIIFQDPYASLNPKMSVRRTLAEAMRVHRICRDKREIEQRIEELMVKVGLSPRTKNDLPFTFSGGQRQRISIARALAVNPAFIVADEPTSALDVSIQAQILNLLVELQNDLNLTYLFISHNLNVVRYISDRIAVMYLGQIVEMTTAAELFRNPLHPYARALLAAVPFPDPDLKTKAAAISGDLPNPLASIPGCRFHSRCPEASEKCVQVNPAMYSPDTDHFVRCLKYER